MPSLDIIGFGHKIFTHLKAGLYSCFHVYVYKENTAVGSFLLMYLNTCGKINLDISNRMPSTSLLQIYSLINVDMPAPGICMVPYNPSFTAESFFPRIVVIGCWRCYCVASALKSEWKEKTDLTKS